MQKLSRIDKYKQYRNQLANDSEKEIATRELKNIQEKIIFNEKRFGNSSRTESDLNRGKRDTSFDSILSNFNYPKEEPDNLNVDEEYNTHTDNLDDIFSELNKYKNQNLNQNDTRNEQDDYINKIKDVVRQAGGKKDIENNEPKLEQPIQDNFESVNIEAPEQEERKDLYDLLNQIENNSESLDSSFEQETKTSESKDSTQEVKEEEKKQDEVDIFAEFEEKEEKPEALFQSQIQDVVLEKPVVKIPVPEQDHSEQFKDVCNNVSLLAEQIESADSFGENNFVKEQNHSVNSSLAGVQQDIKKELINSEENNQFMSNLQQEVADYNNKPVEEEAEEKEVLDNKKHIIKKSEVIGQLKEEFDNTVSLEVDKLRNEINASKADNISANEIIRNNNMAKNDILEDHPGKTIAFEYDKKDIPDNTILLTKPNVEDSSIHTMSFETEDLDIEKEEKSNTLLNIILGILIIIAFVALGVIVYFFLITRGII